MKKDLYFKEMENEILINGKKANSKQLEILLNYQLDKDIEKTIKEMENDIENFRLYPLRYGILKEINDIICNDMFNKNGIIFKINGKKDFNTLNEIYSFIDKEIIFDIISLEYFSFIENGFENEKYFEINLYPLFFTNKDLEILYNLYTELKENDYEYTVKMFRKSFKMFSKIVKRIIKQLCKIIDKYSNLNIDLNIEIEKSFIIMNDKKLFDILEITDNYISYTFLEN